MRPRLISFLLLVPLAAAAQSDREQTSRPVENWRAPVQVRRARVQVREVRTPQIQMAGNVAGDPLIFVPISPCCLADTRSGSGYPALGSTPFAKLIARTLPVWGACGISSQSSPEAYSFNVTVVSKPGTSGDYLLVTRIRSPLCPSRPPSPEIPISSTRPEP
jgi:hypothetical protein